MIYVSTAERILSDHLCECGCGQRTYLAPQTRKSAGWIKGQPKRFLKGHNRRVKSTPRTSPNPSGLCFCGCGEKTPIAPRTNAGNHAVKGEPNRFVPGHQRRGVYKLERDYEVDENGCWIWRLGFWVNGYGKLKRGGRHYLAHRWTWEQAKGPVPEGHDLHHECRNKACVNPDHLRPLTRPEHIRLHQLEDAA